MTSLGHKHTGGVPPSGSRFTLQSFWTLRDPKRIYAAIANPLTPKNQNRYYQISSKITRFCFQPSRVYKPPEGGP